MRFSLETREDQIIFNGSFCCRSRILKLYFASSSSSMPLETTCTVFAAFEIFDEVLRGGDYNIGKTRLSYH